MDDGVLLVSSNEPTAQRRHLVFDLSQGPMLRVSVLIAALTLWLLGISIPLSSTAGGAAGPTPPALTTNRLIVAYDATAIPRKTSALLQRSMRTQSAVSHQRIRSIGFGMHSVLLAKPISLSAATDLASAVSKTPGVAWAEPDRMASITTTHETPADWGLDRIDARADLDNSYSYDTTGAGVTAYVVDTGILSTHQDFSGRVRSGFTSFSTGGTTDCNGHGTHIAGTIGGTTYGVAKGSTLVAVRVLNCAGNGSVSDVIAGLEWIANDHIPGTPAVVNLSLQVPAIDIGLDTAVTSLIDQGISVVVASGNNTADACAHSPADVASAITVNSSFRTGLHGVDYRSAYSDFGPCTDLYAPGQSITSAWIGSDAATKMISGTSMAAPHVAGAIARLLELHPSDSPAQVSDSIMLSATPIDFGSPMAGDPNKLLYAGLAGPSISSPPLGVVSTVNDTSVTVSWSPPSFSGDSSVTSYTADAWTASTAGSLVASCTTSIAPSCQLTGLVAGERVWIDVVATNSTGTSDPSTPRLATLIAPGIPDAPSIGTVTALTSTTVTLSFSAPLRDGGSPITSYVATTSPQGGSGTVTGPSGGTIAVAGLMPNTTYSFTLTAINGVGSSMASTPSSLVTTLPPPLAPFQPRAVTVAPAGHRATVTWSAPSPTNGPPLSRFTARSWTTQSGGTLTRSCSPAHATATTCTISGLTNGQTYFVDVVAKNRAGTGFPSVRVAVTPATVPSSPRHIHASYASGVVTTNWSAPASDGGAPITSVTTEVWSAPHGGILRGTCTTTLSQCSIPGLSATPTSFVDVVASNSIGPGRPSSRSSVSGTHLQRTGTPNQLKVLIARRTGPASP